MLKPIIGLEIHVELNTRSKMFCSCLNDPFEKNPNINICPICLGHPGTLPTINKEALKKVIKTGLSLGCKISEYSRFDRKNYFYPDLPKGYQISQYEKPLCLGGFLQIGDRKIKITRIHLEEDTGKLIHNKGVNYSLVDFNRAGVPLMELVTEPEITSGKEARLFAQELQLILKYLEVSDANMEKGQMRVEVNISLCRQEKKSKFSKPVLGTKVEIKNLNSFRSVERSIEYEIERQEKILKSGKKIIQETRGWHDQKEITLQQREKEEAHDYRYFPEPDLPPLCFEKKEIAEIRSEIPELPSQKRKRFSVEYGLDQDSIEIFAQNKQLGEFFEKAVSELPSNISKEKLVRLVKIASNYLISDLQSLLKGNSVKNKNFLISPENFSEFSVLICEGKISSKIAKIILEEMFRTGADPSHIIEEKGLNQLSDKKELEKIINNVLKQNSKTVLDYKKGKETALHFLVGKVMAETRGKANPEIAKEILKKELGGLS